MKNKHASWEAQQKRKTYQYKMEVLNKLKYHYSIYSELGITEDKIRSAITKFRTEYYDSCKTFSVCPTCDHALTGKKRRKATKSITTFDCNICGRSTWSLPVSPFVQQNRIIHHTETLAEARITIRKTHPELFL